MPKEIFNAIASVNRAVVNQLRQALKRIEEKISAIIASEDKLNQQQVAHFYCGNRQTAVYLIIATKGFESFDNWRKLACYAGVAPFPYQSGTSIKGRRYIL